MRKPPQIDLSKVKIGQRVKLRNGDESQIVKHDPLTSTSFKYDGHDNLSWKMNGAYSNTPKHPFDIIQILPLPKKKVAKKVKKKWMPYTHPACDVKPLQWKLKNEKAIRAAIKLLEGLLKC